MEIEIQEKVPGALQSLISYATNSAFKIENVKSAASNLGILASLLIQQFLAAVTKYISVSREFVYEREQKVGSLVSGPINIAKSVQLRARGLGHLFAFDKDTITFNTPLNRFVLAALMEVERLSQLVPLESEDTVRARGLALLFSDCRDAELLFSDRLLLARLASDLTTSHLTSQQMDVAALASVVLAHESFEHSHEIGSQVPRSWFLNLENLFEQAVMSQLRELVSHGTTVYRGGENPQPIFQRERGTFRGRPDIVLSHEDSRVIVGDVKYKNWSGTASVSDLYQLLVHTSAFSGTTSFLVFPCDEFQTISLGESVTGSDTWLFGLDVGNLADSVNRMVNTLTIDGTIEVI